MNQALYAHMNNKRKMKKNYFKKKCLFFFHDFDPFGYVLFSAHLKK
jgi:hypothetical protein